ncbi:MAG: response regulator [Chloroflexi bacterium]|nr:response regulator [Chloroflexota bacterium]
MWIVTYGAIGLPLAVAAPAGYMVLTIASILQFFRTKGFPGFRFRQTLLILLMPFALHMALGGFVASSGVVLWSSLAPLTALLFHGIRQSLIWFVAYVGLTIMAGAANSTLASASPAVPSAVILVFFVLNFLMVSFIAFAAVQYYAYLLRQEHRREQQLNQVLQVRSVELAAALTQVREKSRQLEEANRHKSTFLAMMSHEIRTPMNAVIGMTSLLLNTDLTPQQREFAGIIRNSSEVLLTIINDILDFSKIEAGRLDLESRPLDLGDCVEGALDLVATVAARKGLDLAYLIDPRVPSIVVGDVTRLRQILSNFLSNAVKFTEAGEIFVSVGAREIVADAPPDDASTTPQDLVSAGSPSPRRCELHFAVKDTGIGIPVDRRDGLFQPFYQVDASTVRKYGGTGLGLSISKRLCELMGGTMWVESEPGKGSTFHFTVQTESVPGEALVYQQASHPKLVGRRLLVVDDNATNRRILTLMAESWGMRARDTASPADALQWIQQGDPFDVAILDHQMPEMDGVTLAAEIRRHREARLLPLVMLTSMDRQDATPATVEFAAFLSKPIKPSALFEVLLGIFSEPGQPIVARVSERAASPDIDPAMARRLPRRILLVEDNAVNQQLALLLLEQLGYCADVAGNGREALEAVGRQPVDVVLMDVQMPEMDGLEASRRLCQQLPPDERPHIIAMTANAMAGDREVCLAAGMDDYISKPIRVDELVGALSRSRPRAVPVDMVAEPAPRVVTATETTVQPAEASALAVLDAAALTRLRQMMSKAPPAALATLVDTFLSSAPKLLAAMETAIERNQAEELRRAAHTLKSNGASFGATTLANQCQELEALGKAGALQSAREKLARARAEFARVSAALTTVRQGL